MRVVVLASGRGSNLAALVAARDAGDLDIELAGVLSDRPTAPALELARSAGVPAIALDARAQRDRAAYDRELFARVAGLQPDLVVLAGFMRILDADALAPWIGRMLNIHPSLLPRHPGLHTHQRALDAGDREHGASVHVVTGELDGGPVIAQVALPILAGDTAETLARRLLPLEHRLLVACVGLAAEGRLSWDGSVPLVDGERLDSPLQWSPSGWSARGHA
ncbi:phosphoribosylglycinamide formyltransferase [Dokdonella sp. MW10]|uniref:phosphoribosylglycinamide formyltransferase n=1 Tax=Dokdonella sp. MW10 TaxID=2992926 RepID=UPI003F7DCC39